MNHTTITFDKMPEAIEFLIGEVARLKEQLTAMVVPAKAAPHKPIEVDEASKITLKAKSTIYRLVREGKIPHRKVGNKLYFFEDELLSWISDSTGKDVSMTKKDIEQQMIAGIRHRPQKREI